jgi:pentatricopeptide repeat protein
MGLFDKINELIKKVKPAPGNGSGGADYYSDLVVKEPGNAKAHLKLAEYYQRKGDKQKAIGEYLLAAEIFMKNNFYARAMAIYKQIPKQDPSLDHVYLKIADIYRKMGFAGDALAQYKIILHHYNSQGMVDKAREIMDLMLEVDPERNSLGEQGRVFQEALQFPTNETGAGKVSVEEKGKNLRPLATGSLFDLGAELETLNSVESLGTKEVETKRLSGFEDILKELKEVSGPSTAYPLFNYQMGMACREMGFLDDAIEQFKVAFKKGQSPFEAANMLGLCFKGKGMWEEARQALEKALKVKGIAQERTLEVKYEIGLILKEEGKIEEALDLLRQISKENQGFRKEEISRMMGGSPVSESGMQG